MQEDHDRLQIRNKELTEEIEKLQRLLQFETDMNKDYKALIEQSKLETRRLQQQYEQQLQDEFRRNNLKDQTIQKLQSQLRGKIREVEIQGDSSADFPIGEG